MDEVLTQHLTSHVLLGWVDGILWLLPSVALRPTLQGLGTGDGMWSLSEEGMFIKTCQVDPLNKLSSYETQNLGGREMRVTEKWVRPSLGP